MKKTLLIIFIITILDDHKPKRMSFVDKHHSQDIDLFERKKVWVSPSWDMYDLFLTVKAPDDAELKGAVSLDKIGLKVDRSLDRS